VARVGVHPQGRYLIWLGLGLAGCVGGAGETTISPDGDGSLRPPHDASRVDDLPATCAAPAPGCPCAGTEGAACYPGPPGTAGVGTCSVGRLSCEGGRYSDCRLAVVPRPELCDGQDNDCDGQTDEDLVDCTPCGANCRLLGVGAGAERSFNEGQAEGGSIRVTPEGALTLEATEMVLNDVWIANTDEGTVSRLDATTGRELARYPSVIERPGLRAWNEICDKENRSKGNCPSRTAVTMLGDVFVANRAFGAQGTVTKILGAACPDRNGDAVVRTSADLDADGKINLYDPDEFPGQADECLDFTVDVGGIDGVLRALAVDPFFPEGEGSIWVGAFEESVVYQLDASDGELLRRLDLPLRPYGALLDHNRVLWITGLAGFDDAIVSVDTAQGTIGPRIPIVNPRSCSQPNAKGGYGISIDSVGRIWVGGWFCEDALRYDPIHESWLAVHLPELGYTRGIAADASGYVWVAHSNEAYAPYAKVARLTRFRAEDGEDRRTYLLPGQSETIGVGLDAAGKVWAVSRSSDHATRLDPATGAMTHHPVGRGPYTYSDFTGYALRTFIAPSGLWSLPLGACPQEGRATWRSLRWEAQVPEGTRLQLYLRVADDASLLPFAYRYGPFASSPTDLDAMGVPHSAYLQLEVELAAADRETAPTLRWVRLEAECPPEG